MSDKRSIVVYRGPSMLPGHESEIIRAVITRESSNVKTGNMAQLWILPDDVSPLDASKSGQDAAICGECPQRQSLGGGCYVTLFQGPLATWRASHRSTNLWRGLAFLRSLRTARDGAVLRLGAYGDPAALPEGLVSALVRAVDGRVTGYTHQWRYPSAAWARSYVMASVESRRDALIAQSAGWRTFRVATDALTMPSEIVCVNESRGVTCAQCGLCNGGRFSKARSITIPVHGWGAKRAAKVCEVSN